MEIGKWFQNIFLGRKVVGLDEFNKKLPKGWVTGQSLGECRSLNGGA